MFAAADKDKSGSLTARELMTMKWGDGRTLSFGTCEALARVFDADRSGTIEFFEFAALHQFVGAMFGSFFNFDRDRSGTLEFSELAQALAASGFQFSQITIQALLRKFGKQTMEGGKVELEVYMQICAFMGQLKATFDRLDAQRSGTVHLNLEQLVTIVASF